MIKNLVYKEFRLNIVKYSYLWFASVLLLFIPGWVFFVAIGYIFFLFMILTQTDKVNNDLAFALSLPVPKSGIVMARACTLVIIELAVLVAAVPVCVARYYLYPGGNNVTMNTNIVFFAAMLIMFSTFNIIYLPGAYSKAYRILRPFLGGYVTSLIVGGVITFAIALSPALAPFNDRGLGQLGLQIACLGFGILVYAGLTYLSYRRARANFAKVDL